MHPFLRMPCSYCVVTKVFILSFILMNGPGARRAVASASEASLGDANNASYNCASEFPDHLQSDC